MRTKLDKLDRITEERIAGEVDREQQTSVSPTATSTSRGPLVHIHLGAPEKSDKPILELMETPKFSFPGLLRMLERFINKFRTREEGYYKVQKDHMVSAFISFSSIGS